MVSRSKGLFNVWVIMIVCVLGLMVFFSRLAIVLYVLSSMLTTMGVRLF